MLSPLTAAETRSKAILEELMLTSPPEATKLEMKKADVITVGTVTVPPNIEARVSLRRIAPR